jgi:hypothetical protein
MRRRVNEALGKDAIRVFVGLMTKEEGGRRADFYDHFESILTPEGVMIFKNKAHGQSPARGRNMLIEQAFENNCTHILFVDDDVYLPPDVISRLLSHDKDIVTGLYISRSYPHRPYLFRAWDEATGAAIWAHLRDGETGLIPIVAAGFGICLIKTSVFAKLEKPYIRLGEMELDQWCDDIGFFSRVSKAGIKVFCDLDCQAGHSFSGIARPVYADGKWFTTIDTKGEAQLTFLQVTEQPVEV